MRKLTAAWVIITVVAALILGAIAPRSVSAQNLGSSIKIERLVFPGPLGRIDCRDLRAGQLASCRRSDHHSFAASGGRRPEFADHAGDRSAPVSARDRV